MPRFGSLDIKGWTAPVAEIYGYKTEALVLKGAQVLQVAFEIDASDAERLYPPALCPAIPPYAVFTLGHYPESPAGAFSSAEVRVVGRAGFRPRAFVMRNYIDNEDAAQELARRWGYPAQVAGPISLDLRYDRIQARVELEGKTVLACELIDRDLIAGNDIQWVASLHLARNKEDGKLVLVQVDPEFVFSKAERGRPQVNTWDKAAWNATAIELTNPISASYAICDVTLPKIRYVVDPERPALQGTTKVAA